MATRPCTLLYVDPDAGTRLLVRKVLEPEGIVVVEAATPLGAQLSADQVRPTVVLVDVDRVDRTELSPLLLAPTSEERTVWLASTALPWPEHCAQILASGFERVLLKPLDVDTLADDIGCGPRLRPVSLGLVDGSTRHRPGTNGTNGTVAVEPPSFPAGGVGDGDEAGALEQPLTSADEPADPEEPFEVAAIAAEPEVRTLPQIWHLTLAPLIASFVQALSTTHGLLALLDESESALVLVAAYSIRPVQPPPVAGTALLLRELGWLEPALRSRQLTVVSTHGIAPSPLVPPGSNTVLIAPVATAERVHGVAILGEQRSSRAGVFASAALAQCAAEARQIAVVVESLRQLERTIREKRNEMVEVRLDLVHGLLTDLSVRSRRHRKNEAGRERPRRRPHASGGRGTLARLALDVADMLKLPAEEREVLHQALDVEDIGRTWLEHMLFPRMTLPASVRDALLDSYASHSAEILSELDWPAAVVDLIRLRHARWDGEGSLPLGARILAVAGAYGAVALTEADAPDGEAIAELERHSGSRLDPAVVAAFIERLAATSLEP